MKRLICYLLTFAMLLSLLPVISSTAIAVGTPTLVVESKHAASGSSVEVDISVENNPGIAGARFSVSFGDDLTLVEAVPGETFAALDYTAPESLVSSCYFNWDSLDAEVAEDGVLLTLTFEVSEAAQPNETLSIDVSYRYGDIYNSNLDSLEFDLVNGIVTIINYIPGDVNSDGVVNGKDVTLIRRLNAGAAVEINLAAADVNDDGVINGKDVTLIRRKNAGYDVELVPSTPRCKHAMEPIAYKAPTCTEEGNISYYYCTECEKYFNDEAGSREITLDQTVISAIGHTEVIDPVVEPTTTTEGLTEGSHCSVCGTVIKEQKPIPSLEVKSHEITYDIANGDPYLEKLLNNGEITNPNPAYYAETDGLTFKNISVAGYRFKGWADVTGAVITKIPAGSTDDFELYATWEKISYTVQYKSSLFVDRAQDTYTVDTGLVLPTPKLSNYVFTGWADENGALYSGTTIPVGTTGNIILEANWTSERNKTWTKQNLDAPITYTEDNILYFVYEIGEIQNVPLYTIKDFGYISEGGVSKSEETTYSLTISEGTAKQISEAVSKATTASSNWSLSSGWSEGTEVSQEWLTEKGISVEDAKTIAKNEESNWNISSSSYGSTDTSVGSSNEKGWTNEAKISSSSSTTRENKVAASLESSLSTEAFGVEAEISASIDTEESISRTSSSGLEIGGSTAGTDLETSSTNTSSGWSNDSSYGGSKSSSESKTTSTAISERITEQYGYGKNYTSEHTSGESQGLEQTTSGSEEYSSAVTFDTSTGEEFTRSWTTQATKAGYHRWIVAGTAHVFAVVGYDMETQDYFVYTYTVMDDKTHEFEDYSYTTASYNDHENGVISFEIPYEVAELVAEQTTFTQGLKVDQATGTITGYEGTENCVVIPEYMNVGNGDVVKITAIAPGAFANKTNISAVVLSEFVTEIPDDCFMGCTSLEGVVGGSVTKIGTNAFNGCTSMVDCAVRTKIESVGENAFVGVERVIYNCANAEVAKSANTCGAKNICIYLNYIEDTQEMSGITLEIPAGTEYFEINGNENTYTDLTIISDAKQTVLNKTNLVGTDSIPLVTSSEKLVLNQSSISATGIALVLKAEQAELSLQSNITINSENDNAILCKGVTFTEHNDNVDGRLIVNDILLHCGEVVNKELVTKAEYKEIDGATYENMLNSFTLYFDANGGSCDEESRSVPNSTKLGTLPTPTREHYSFNGWFLADGTAVNENSVFSTGADITVYAHWAPISYTVSWNTGAGYSIAVSRTSSPNASAATGALSNGATVYYGDVLSISYGANSGYTLTGQGSTSITVSGNVTASSIYASAKVNSYTVSWNTGTGYSISVSRTSSPKAGAATGNLSNGATIYYGDVLSVSYSASTGYSLSNKGQTSITVGANVGSSQIYASASPNSYTYNIVYKSSNGTSLGSSTATYKYGTTNTISAPAKSGYNTPSAQSVTWDSTSAKTITFTYTPAAVSNSTKSGTVCTKPNMYYSATVSYQNRTATSVQIRVTWTTTIEASGYNSYGQRYQASVGSVGTGDVIINSYGTWKNSSSSARSSTGTSGWITVPLSTTNATSVSMGIYYYQVNSNGTDMTKHYGEAGLNLSWTINIPAY